MTFIEREVTPEGYIEHIKELAKDLQAMMQAYIRRKKLEVKVEVTYREAHWGIDIKVILPNGRWSNLLFSHAGDPIVGISKWNGVEVLQAMTDFVHQVIAVEGIK